MDKNSILIIVAVSFLLLPSTLLAQTDTAWTRRYNGPGNGNDEAHCCIVDGQGNLYVTGGSSNGSNSDFFTIKYNAFGDTLWTRRYDGSYDDAASCCALDRSGNLYVTGYNTVETYSHTNILTIKYNGNGDTIWARVYNTSPYYDAKGFGCAVDDSDNLYVVGLVTGAAWDWFVIKYNPAGDVLWTSQYNGPASGHDIAHCCVIDSEGYIYVTGVSNTATDGDFLTIKYNAAGDTLWSRRYNGPANYDDDARCCAIDNAGCLYVIGYSYHTLYGTTDFLTIKYNSDGDTLWTRRYNGPDNYYDEAYGCAFDSSWNLYVVGHSSFNYLIIEYNAAGDIISFGGYNGPSYDICYSCAFDRQNKLYVTGSSWGSNYDYLTIKYNSLALINGMTEKPSLPVNDNKMRLEQNNPNPFKRSTSIRYQLPSSRPASLKIYNAMGQLIKTFDLSQQRTGYNQVEWNDSHITAGVYFYSLTQGNYQTTKKLVVLK